jgi:epoxyqueuosine reductase
VPQVEKHLGDASPLVRAMAVWALSRLAPHWAAAVRELEAQAEGDPAVADEWARVGA